jgi:hypothetical protein
MIWHKALDFQRIGQQQGNNADASGCGSLTYLIQLPQHLLNILYQDM